MRNHAQIARISPYYLPIALKLPTLEEEQLNKIANNLLWPLKYGFYYINNHQIRRSFYLVLPTEVCVHFLVGIFGKISLTRGDTTEPDGIVYKTEENMAADHVTSQISRRPANF